MKCLNVEQLERIVVGPGDTRSMDAIDDHLRVCASCRRRLAELRDESRFCAAIRTSMHADGSDETYRSSSDEPLPHIDGLIVYEEVHRGGQAVVYKGRQSSPSRNVAVKVLLHGPFASARQRVRFEREIELVASLQHPNIVTVYESGVSQGRHFYVMEYVNGPTLDVYLTASDPPLNHKLNLFLSICSAVHYAHQHGVIHRDLKPTNILIEADDDAGNLIRPRVVDFGLARLQPSHTSGHTTLTQDGHLLGTPAFASPEQVQGSNTDIDVRTDVYSLGVILYVMLTGTMPYETTGSLVSTLRNISESDVPAPSSRKNHLNREIDAILLTALQKDRSKRYQSVDSFAADIRRYLHAQPVLAHAPSALYLLRKSFRRHRTAWVLATTTALFLLTAFIASLIVAAKSEQQRKAEFKAKYHAIVAQAGEGQARRHAERVSAFLTETLSTARPSVGGGDATLLEMLQHASERADAELEDFPTVAAEIHFTIGRTFRSLWMWREAKPHLDKALRLRREIHDTVSPAVAECLMELGTVLTSLRDPEAIDLQEEALSSYRQLYGESSAEAARGMIKLAYALSQAAEPPDFVRGEQLMSQALAIMTSTYGRHHRETASCLHNFAYVRLLQHRWDEANELYVQALDIFRRIDDITEPYYAECLHGYSGFLNTYEQGEQCAAVLDEALPVVGASFGRRGQQSLYSRRAIIHSRYSRHEESIHDAARALSIACETSRSPCDEAESSYMIESARLRGTVSPESAATSCLTLLQACHEAEHAPPARVLREICTVTTCLLEAGHIDAAQQIVDGLDEALQTGQAMPRLVITRSIWLKARLLEKRGEYEAALDVAHNLYDSSTAGSQRLRLTSARAGLLAARCLVHLQQPINARKLAEAAHRDLQGLVLPQHPVMLEAHRVLSAIPLDDEPA